MINTPRSIGNYVLEHELGRGATGQVWKGRHRFLNERVVAVKILLSQDEESVARFSREADLASRLRHPNVVEVYDHGTAGSFLYSIMELVQGGSLRQYMEKNQRVPLKDAVNIFRQIGGALDFAHKQQIIHRDISPGNILLDPTPAGRALLTDFGIARLPQQSHTTTMVIMGTPGFFSPEHAQSATAVTSLSDLYGLGVVLYFMLTGQLPWEKQPEHPDYRFGPIIPLGERGVDLPTDVDRVFQTLLAVDPRKRYPTAEAACEALERALSRAGITFDNKSPAADDTATFRAINTAPSYQAFGVLESEVEQALGPDLLREPIEKAHARAESLRDPLVLANLLDDWSEAGAFHEFRMRHLGRIVNLRDVRSRNVYFYHLDVLLETREEPALIEEPDRDANSFPVRREQERWQVKLPRPAAFADDPGRAEIIQGSERVIECPRCEGQGQEICPQCKGSRRILQTRTVPVGQTVEVESMIHQQDTVVRSTSGRGGSGGAAVAEQPMVAPQVEVRQTLVPCPICAGAGGLNCAQCQGIGRLVQRKVFRWHRTALHRSSRDDVPGVDEQAIRNQVELVTVYQERAGKLKREWASVPGLSRLIADVERQAGPDTRVVMAEATIKMIPFTTVQLDLGRREIVVDTDAPPKPPRSDAIHTVQIYGFENTLQVGSFAIDGERRLLWLAVILCIIIVVIYSVFVFFIL